MKKEGYYSAGELMKLAHITKKTIRYYDEHHILKPSYVEPNTRTRFYTDDDLARLQQILLFKALGFSLSDIMEMTINESDTHFMVDSLNLQKKLVEDRIEQLQIVARTIQETTQLISSHQTFNWTKMLNQIHDLGMETSMKRQYQNASNISARIHLHSLFSHNNQSWFSWIFDQANFSDGQRVLEVGCGNATFWAENYAFIPDRLEAVLSDISGGMLRDARRTLGQVIEKERQTGAGLTDKVWDSRFSFRTFNCETIPYEDASFDLVLANHVLFYCEDIDTASAEIARVLKPGGVFLCSTYGKEHMKEISQLVSSFDDRIVLSSTSLYDCFGKENGTDILAPHFSQITWRQYEDYLTIPEPEPLISYILSCHGNQNQYILEHYKEFAAYVKKKTTPSLHVTKDAGCFLCTK